MFEEYFDLDSILSYIQQAPWLSGLDKKAIGALNGLLNLLFGIGKSIVLAGNFLIEKVYSLNLLNESLDQAFKNGSAVWDSLFKTLGVVFLSVIFLYACRDIFTHGIEKIFLRLLLFGSLVVIATGFYTQGSTWLKEINTISSNLQNELVGVMAPDISKESDKLATELGLTSPTEETEKVENMLYYKFILEPFALFNYGKTNISKEQLTELTAKKGKYNDEKQKIIEKNVETAAKKNAYLTGKKLGDKYLILINSGVDYVIVAGVILLVAVMNFLLQVFLLVLVLISPIWVLLALLPDNEHVLFNGLKLIFGTFAAKIALGIGFGLVFMVLNFINSAFALTSLIAIVASLIVKIILAILVVKNFSWFKRAITKAEVDRLPELKTKNSAKPTAPASQYPVADTGNPPALSKQAEEGQGVNTDYADNIQLQSALEEDAPTSNRGENILRGMGYAASRGVGHAMLDKAGNTVKAHYEDSKMQSMVNGAQNFADSPSGYLKEKISPYASAYTDGQLQGMNKKYGVNSEEEPEFQFYEEPEEKTPASGYAAQSEDFDTELAHLRGETPEPPQPMASSEEELAASINERSNISPRGETQSEAREVPVPSEPNPTVEPPVPPEQQKGEDVNEMDT